MSLVERWLLAAPEWGDAPAGLVALAERYRARTYAPSTRAYRERHLRDWFAFCERHACTALPAEELTVCAMIAELAQRGNAVSSIRNVVSTINALHLTHGYPRPGRGRLHEVLRGIARESVRRRSLPLTRDLVIDMVRRARKRRRRLTALRDAAILLVFHHSALRCSELAGIRVEDIAWSPQGILLTIPRSKGDQYGEGQHVAIEADPDQYLCPVRALRAWLDEAHIDVGYVFRWIHPTGHGGPVQLPDRPLTHSSLNHYVKEYAAEIGLDPTDYTTRSMRSGYATTAWRAGESALRIQRTLRHRNIKTTTGYIDGTSPFERNLSRTLGL